jgi:hypothetical protein
MSMHTKMTMGQAHARRSGQSEGIRFIICFGRWSNKPPSGLADSSDDLSEIEPIFYRTIERHRSM